MKYDVHLYVAGRIKVEGVEAVSQLEAALIAERDAPLYELFKSGQVVWDEGPALGALVDEEGDEDYDRSRYHSLDGAEIFYVKGPV